MIIVHSDATRPREMGWYYLGFSKLNQTGEVVQYGKWLTWEELKKVEKEIEDILEKIPSK